MSSLPATGERPRRSRSISTIPRTPCMAISNCRCSMRMEPAFGLDPWDERCILPIHVYDAETGHCVLTILRPGKTPDGKEMSAHLRRLVRRIRLHWPNTRITIRGDSHYGRREAMDWCEQNGALLYQPP